MLVPGSTTYPSSLTFTGDAVNPLQTWEYTPAGLLVRYGRGDITPPGTDRDSLVIESYIPDAGTTGLLPGVALTNYNSAATSAVTLSAGTYTNKRIYGEITWSGNVTLNNCELLGGNTALTSDKGIINGGSSSNVGHLTAIDCEIHSQVESNGRNGTQGKEFTLTRCHIYGVVDGVGILTLTSSGVQAANVTVEGCLIEDLVYVYPDNITTSHTDGTHNDCIQIQGGSNILIRGNRLMGTSHKLAGTGTNPAKPYLLDGGRSWANGAGIIVQKQGTTYAVANCVVRKNWFSGGLAHVNAKTASAGTWTYTGNVHYHDMASKPAGYPSGDSLSEYCIRIESRAASNITGINVGGQQNRWDTTWRAGALLAEPTAAGLTYDGA
jgi:hypothetical protein